ncbi:MAG TPA: hypothetical protein VFV34_04590 [Blastocatellia bacterium]|nr:hypothetical protein [Blastocatellia bacterium]
MILTGTILLVTVSCLGTGQDDRNKESTYTVTLEETGCAPTRRIRCSYRFVEVSSGQNRKDKRHFSLLFYMGADQAEGKEDAISRLDRFFGIKREASSAPGAANTDTVGYKQPVTLRRQGSRYKFSREDGETIVVDIEKTTRP